VIRGFGRLFVALGLACGVGCDERGGAPLSEVDTRDVVGETIAHDVVAEVDDVREEAIETSVPDGDGAAGDLAEAEVVATEGDPLVAMAVRFYGAQRSGDAGNWLLGGAGCHAADGESVGLDLGGGWHDAGDHLKFTLTTAYAAYALFKAYEAFPEAFVDAHGPRYGPADGLPDVLGEAIVGADWLLRVRQGDSIVARVGDQSDHNQWVTCVRQQSLSSSQGGRPRSVLMGAHADLAALSAAALAIGARVLAPFDAARSASYLAEARALYAFAEGHEGGAGFADAFYTNSVVRDDLMCGAAELWATTDEAGYLSIAKGHDAARKATGWVLDYANVDDLCRHTLAARGEGSSYWKSDVRRYADKVDANGVASFGQWGLLRYALGAAFSAALYARLEDDGPARDFALGQLAYATGDNAAGYSFVVGWGERYPRFPHHRNAYGDDTNPPDDVKNRVPPKYVLAGALVGGTSPPGDYPDRLTDYRTSEVALDFNAALVGVAAFAATLTPR